MRGANQSFLQVLYVNYVSAALECLQRLFQVLNAHHQYHSEYLP
jgi:hypothetical protein